MTSIRKPIALIILDGFGYAPPSQYNPINEKNMPFFFSLLSEYPWTTLQASGKAVGLPDGTPGNSAVGHLTIGAGRIIEQPLTQFIQLIRENKLSELPVIKKEFTQLARSGKSLHVLGLASDGNSHSRLEFIQAIIKVAAEYKIKDVIIHAILDGRDVPQKSAKIYLKRIEKTISELPQTTTAKIGTIQGRLYAMDRNQNIDRLNRAYTILTQSVEHRSQSWEQALENYYQEAFYDETIPPTQLIQDAIIEPGDGLVFVNIRADRSRGIYKLLKNNAMLSFIISGINYSNSSHNTKTICDVPHIADTLNEYLELHNIKTFSIAESEKRAHISYFFDGGSERIRSNEARFIVPSDSIANFSRKPAMKAEEITHALLQELRHHKAKFYLINYANADMIGHSGNLIETEKALTILDAQLRQACETFLKQGGTVYITGDHGNAEDMYNNNPAHTTNPVYFVVVSQPKHNKELLKGMTGLADIKDRIIQNSFSS